MYQVIIMYGDSEPWWFLEHWQKDIIEEKVFDCFNDAQQYYLHKSQELDSCYGNKNTKNQYLSAFWNDGEERWCDECDEYLQQYKGLALLKDCHSLTESKKNMKGQESSYINPRQCKLNHFK